MGDEEGQKWPSPRRMHPNSTAGAPNGQFGLKSVLTQRCMEPGKFSPVVRARERGDRRFQSAIEAGNQPGWVRQIAWNLMNLRSAMAHGTAQGFLLSASACETPPLGAHRRVPPRTV
jgi:hypothetical protein